ncbi:hypothetical protein PS691_01953 [Pseudomonas fluorescens]|uniref:HTH lysR-type domain-containing protein n=1 Tax=Pseudomonas fluorescens TaxID=294 RepID=A0A5E7BKH9_PSEFL|nr:hypothetical protein PS691_01953 [Pseudomonas fluorescens]
MDVFQSMRIFIAVAQSGSFTAAAELLNTTTTNVSKAVSALEARLHTRLINRTTRRLALTEAGIRYLQRCEKILDDVREADEEAGTAQTLPVGRLKIHAMSAIGNHDLTMSLACPSQHCDISFRRDSKQSAVFAAELRRAFIADFERRARYILMLVEHQAPRLV